MQVSLCVIMTPAESSFNHDKYDNYGGCESDKLPISLRKTLHLTISQIDHTLPTLPHRHLYMWFNKLSDEVAHLIRKLTTTLKLGG